MAELATKMTLEVDSEQARLALLESHLSVLKFQRKCIEDNIAATTAAIASIKNAQEVRAVSK